MANICKTVCAYFEVPVEKIRIYNRKPLVAYCRFMCYYFIKQKTQVSSKDIARYFETFDRSSISHGLKTIKDLLEVDPNVRADYMEISKLLRELQIKRTRKKV